jgi:hypothetical protein
MSEVSFVIVLRGREIALMKKNVEWAHVQLLENSFGLNRNPYFDSAQATVVAAELTLRARFFDHRLHRAPGHVMRSSLVFRSYRRSGSGGFAHGDSVTSDAVAGVGDEVPTDAATSHE